MGSRSKGQCKVEGKDDNEDPFTEMDIVEADNFNKLFVKMRSWTTVVKRCYWNDIKTTG